MVLSRELLYLLASIAIVASNPLKCPPRRNCPHLVDVVRVGNISMVKKLLKTCDVDSMSADNRTALHRAVNMGRPELVFLLLDRGADPRRTDPRGLTPLHLAANSTHAADVEETVAQLLLGDADRLARDHRGRLPLHFAARCGRLNAARLLLTPCDPTCRLSQMQSRDDGLSTPDEYARRYGHGRAAMWLKTVKREAAEMKVISLENEMRVVPLNKPNCAAMAKPHRDINKLRRLLRSCNVDSVDSKGETALMYAIRTSADATFTLLTYGSHVNHVCQRSLNALQYLRQNSESIGLILLHKANTYQKGVGTEAGLTPLHVASMFNNIVAARLLLTNCDSECKLRQLRSLNNKRKTPSELTTNTVMRRWLNQVHTEAAEQRVRELQRGGPSLCGYVAGARDRKKTDIIEIRSQLDNMKQTLHRFIASIKEVLNVTNKTSQTDNANESTTVPHTKA